MSCDALCALRVAQLVMTQQMQHKYKAEVMTECPCRYVACDMTLAAIINSLAIKAYKVPVSRSCRHTAPHELHT